MQFYIEKIYLLKNVESRVLICDVITKAFFASKSDVIYLCYFLRCYLLAEGTFLFHQELINLFKKTYTKFKIKYLMCI